MKNPNFYGPYQMQFISDVNDVEFTQAEMLIETHPFEKITETHVMPVIKFGVFSQGDLLIVEQYPFGKEHVLSIGDIRKPEFEQDFPVDTGRAVIKITVKASIGSGHGLPFLSRDR